MRIQTSMSLPAIVITRHSKAMFAIYDEFFCTLCFNNRMLPDSTDLKLLSMLGRNCRLSDTVIAEALRISKDTVAYRTSALERAGLIQSYLMFIDARRLGFTRNHLLIRFDSSLKNRRALYERLSRVPFVIWINTFIGRFDVQVIVDSLDSFHLNEVRNAVFEACSHRIKDYSVLSCMYDLEFTNVSGLPELETTFERRDDFSFAKYISERSFCAPMRFERVNTTDRDLRLLQSLSENPRATISLLATQIGSDRQTIRATIKRLITSGVILNFGCVSDLSKLGFVTYYLLVRMDQSAPENVFRRPFERLRNIFYAGRMVGDYDMILYLNARSPKELNSSIEVLRAALREHMLHYDLLVQDQVHYWKHFAPGLFEHLSKGLITPHSR